MVALFLVLGVVLYRNVRPEASAGSDAPVAIAFKPLKVPSPALHLDQLARIRQLAYKGSHRNIFSATPPPPPPSPQAAGKDALSAAPAGPPVPPPVQIPLKFYGMAIDPKTGNKLAFFTNGDNVHIASPGETLLGHFRLLSIGANTVEVEDTSSGRTATLAMTLPSPGSTAAPPPSPATRQPPGPRPLPMFHPPAGSAVVPPRPGMAPVYRRPHLP